MPGPLRTGANEGDLAQWTAIDDLIADAIVPEDAALAAVFAANADADLPPIDVSPPQGKLLHMLARMIDARRVLEVGTLGGYSTIWLARALPADGAVVTFEFDPGYAEVAAKNIAAAGCDDKVEIRVGDAHESFPQLIAERPEPFDFVFLDADKRSNPEYFNWSLKLTKPGSVIVVDNVVRHGDIVSDPNDPDARGSIELHRMLSERDDITATSIQTVGSKGWDGFTLALIGGDA
ncbi:MAG: O-methyltransferase [Solirubrobacterales bacterium]